MTQDPPIGQTVGRQGSLQNIQSFPPRDPVIGTGANLGMDLSEALAFKRWLQNEVFNQASIKSPMRPQAAIDADPALQFMQRMASVLKDESELAVQKHLPHRYSDFMKANQKVHDSLTWLPTMQGHANRFASPGKGLSLSNLANRRLLAGALGVAGAGQAATGNVAGGLGLAGLAVGSEVLGHAAELYGHPLSASMLASLQAKAGVLKNPKIPRLFVKSLAGIRAQGTGDDNAESP